MKSIRLPGTNKQEIKTKTYRQMVPKNPIKNIHPLTQESQFEEGKFQIHKDWL